jgi:hypothetical protein
MLRTFLAPAVVAAMALAAGHAVAAQPPTTTQPVAVTPPADGMAALTQASQASKFLLIFFHRGDDANTAAMRKVFDGVAAKAADKANSFVVEVTNPAEKAVVTKFGVSAAPMPLALMVAPNGAITRGAPTKFTDKDLEAGFVGPAWQGCYKAVQERKMVILSVQNGSTQYNAEATEGIRSFTSDSRYSQTQVIALDPSNPAEGDLLAKLQIDPKTKQAVTVLLAPPIGMVVSKITGKVDKNVLASAVAAAQSGKCGPNGCGPNGCK